MLIGYMYKLWQICISFMDKIYTSDLGLKYLVLGYSYTRVPLLLLLILLIGHVLILVLVLTPTQSVCLIKPLGCP